LEFSWTADIHKKERNWLVTNLTQLAASQRIRITILSGDVHAAACGRFFSLKKTPPEQDPKYILNVVTSAIVNTPPPSAVLTMVNKLATKRHKTLHGEGIDEDMIGLWEIDTDGTKNGRKYILGRRNYAMFRVVEGNGDLEIDWQVEVQKGLGMTKT
jgi:hypothetical protein